MSNETSNCLIHSEQCHKFESCSATYCPLDSQRAKRAVHRDDPACFYLLEVGKPGSKERFSVGHSESMYELALKVFEEAISTACPIKKSLLRAKNTPTRMHPVGKAVEQMGVAS
jgi:hypothetical protein